MANFENENAPADRFAELNASINVVSAEMKEFRCHLRLEATSRKDDQRYNMKKNAYANSLTRRRALEEQVAWFRRPKKYGLLQAQSEESLNELRALLGMEPSPMREQASLNMEAAREVASSRIEEQRSTAVSVTEQVALAQLKIFKDENESLKDGYDEKVLAKAKAIVDIVMAQVGKNLGNVQPKAQTEDNEVTALMNQVTQLQLNLQASNTKAEEALKGVEEGKKLAEAAKIEADRANTAVANAEREVEAAKNEIAEAMREAQMARNDASTANDKAEKANMEVESAKREMAAAKLEAESAKREMAAAMQEAENAKGEMEACKKERKASMGKIMTRIRHGTATRAEKLEAIQVLGPKEFARQFEQIMVQVLTDMRRLAQYKWAPM